MAKYKIWNKTDDIYTIGKDKDTGKNHWTAQDYIDYNAPWAANPNVQIIVSGGDINGALFMSFSAVKEQSRSLGMNFDESISPEEFCTLLELWENDQVDAMRQKAESEANAVTYEERMAIALEYQNIMNS